MTGECLCEHLLHVGIKNMYQEMYIDIPETNGKMDGRVFKITSGGWD